MSKHQRCSNIKRLTKRSSADAQNLMRAVYYSNQFTAHPLLKDAHACCLDKPLLACKGNAH